MYDNEFDIHTQVVLKMSFYIGVFRFYYYDYIMEITYKNSNVLKSTQIPFPPLKCIWQQVFI